MVFCVWKGKKIAYSEMYARTKLAMNLKSLLLHFLYISLTLEFLVTVDN